MSKYTTLLRWIVEQELDDKNLAHDEDNWEEVYEKLGLSDYPIFNEEYRRTLNDKIIRRYYFREIGFETSELFRWYMRRTMFEIMPYYNQLYESEIVAKALEPLLSFKEYRDRNTETDFTGNTKVDAETRNKHEDETTTQVNSSVDTDYQNTERDTGTTDTVTHDENVFSDTPMNMLHDNDEPNPIASAKWATNVTYDNGTSATTHDNTDHNSGTNNVLTESNTLVANDGTYKTENDSDTDTVTNNVENETVNYKGFRESQAKLLQQYRETFLNIDMMVMAELKDLFMLLW